MNIHAVHLFQAGQLQPRQTIDIFPSIIETTLAIFQSVLNLKFYFINILITQYICVATVQLQLCISFIHLQTNFSLKTILWRPQKRGHKNMLGNNFEGALCFKFFI